VIGGLDSSFDAPTAAEADAARAAGVRMWSGYLALPGGGRGLASPWSPAGFANARRCGAPPLAFCSGWDDPGQLRAAAAALGVRLCLDIEENIRDLGDWAQPWLDASGAGVYGRAEVHALRAAFHVLAAYPGSDPAATWSGAPPADGTPTGWQWHGSHGEFGCQVDRGWYDDWFAGEDMDDPTLIAMHHVIQDSLFGFIDPTGQQAFLDAIHAGVPMNSIWDGWQALPAAAAWSEAKARALANSGVDLSQLATDLQRIIDDLKAAAKPPS
jgi:hypothetical protein